MIVPTPPAPIPLSRVHRLLRPLRAALSNLSFDLVALEAKQLELQHQAVHALSRKLKTSTEESDDEEWARSSPFRPGARRRKTHKAQGKVTTTYSRRDQTQSHISRSTRTASGTSAPEMKRGGSRRSTGSGGGMSMLLDARARLTRLKGWDQELINKALHLIKTYQNLLESVVSSSKGKEKERDLPSLVELMARGIGWNIEANVRSCREEEEEDSSEDEGVAMRKKAELDEGDDETTLMDEWYEACPDYCSRWLLAEHATAIVIEGLESPPFELLEILSELCAQIGAVTESSRFFDALHCIGLPLPDPTSSAHAIALQAISQGNSSVYYDSLRSTLLDSTFADRLFYSPFLSLSRAQLRSGDMSDADAVAGVLEVACDVAQEMLVGIDAAARNGERGGERLASEVIDRVARETGIAMRYLMERQGADALTIAQAKSDKIVDSSSARMAALGRVLNSALEVVVAAPLSSNSIDDLGPYLVAIAVEIALQSLEDDSIASTLGNPLAGFARLESLLAAIDHNEEGDDDDDDELDADHLISKLLPFAKHHTSQSFAALVVLLRTANLTTLERLVVHTATEAYDTLIDVRSTRGLAVLKRKIFEERRDELERRATGRSIDRGKRPSNEQSTPARPMRVQHLSSSVGRPAIEDSSPALAHSSLGKSKRKEFVPFRLKGTPSRPPNFAMARSKRSRGVLRMTKASRPAPTRKRALEPTPPKKKAKKLVSRKRLAIELSESDSESESEDDEPPFEENDDDSETSTEVLDLVSDEDEAEDEEAVVAGSQCRGPQILPKFLMAAPTSEVGDDLDLLLSATKRGVRGVLKNKASLSASEYARVPKRNKILRRVPVTAADDTSDDELAI